jgi:hypothetical protein
MAEEREPRELAREIISKEEEALRLVTGDVRYVVADILEQKGYLPEEIEKDREFRVSLSDREETVSTDYIVKPGGRRYMAIKCSMEIVSRERHIVAFSRVVDSFQIPLSAVTDGITAHIVDTVSGKIISEDMDSIPSREEALRRSQETSFTKLPAEKQEGEKRILLAFEFVSCPTGKRT